MNRVLPHVEMMGSFYVATFETDKGPKQYIVEIEKDGSLSIKNWATRRPVAASTYAKIHMKIRVALDDHSRN